MSEIKDVIIIGAGPSALAAAIYTAREGLETVLYEKGVIGGLAASTDRIDNYPGFPDGVSGLELSKNMRRQAERFGAKIEIGHVESLRVDGDTKILIVDGREVRAKAVLIATGNNYATIGVPGETEYYGRGVHYCATCDGALYHGKRLAVVGGGNSAIQEALFLTRFAEHIDLLVRSSVKACAALQNELEKSVDASKITVHLRTTIDEIVAEGGRVSGVNVIENNISARLAVDGVFIFAGLYPNTDFLKNSGVNLDPRGFVVTDANLQTNLSGVFASGDVRSGSIMQIACAVGDGVKAASVIDEYLAKISRV